MALVVMLQDAQIQQQIIIIHLHVMMMAHVLFPVYGCTDPCSYKLRSIMQQCDDGSCCYGGGPISNNI